LGIIIIDVDGTLIADNKIPSKEVVESLSKLSKKNKLILASGRPYFGLKEIFSAMGSTYNTIALNGAAIYSESTTGFLEEYSIGKEVLSDILRRIWAKDNIAISAYSNSEWFVKKIDNIIEKEAELLQIVPKQISLKDLLNKEILKISLIFNDEEELYRCFLLLKEANVSVFKSAEKNLEITARGVDKGSGFKKLINVLGIDIDNDVTIFIGNSDNDIPMCREVDLSYSVANSSVLFRNEAQHALAKNDGEALLELTNAINRNKNFGKGVDLLNPQFLDVVNQNMEIINVSQPVGKVHGNNHLHLSLCMVFKTNEEEFLLRLKEDNHGECKDIYCCTYNLHIPSSYTVDRTVNQFMKNFNNKLVTVQKLGYKHIVGKDEICHFFAVRINHKWDFEPGCHRWVSRDIIEEAINKGKATEYLEAYHLLDSSSNFKVNNLEW